MWSQEEYKELREAVHDYFHEFGESPCEIVFQELIRFGTMGPMLERLDVPDPVKSDDQYAAILNFLRHYGIETFARILDNPKVNPADAKREALEKRRLAMSETASHRLLAKLRRRDDNGLPTEFDLELPRPALAPPPRATPQPLPPDERPAAVLRPVRHLETKLPPAAKRQFARIKVDLEAVVHESSTEIATARSPEAHPPVPDGTEMHPPLEAAATPPEVNPPTPLPHLLKEASGISLPRGFVASNDAGRAAPTRKRPGAFQKVIAEPHRPHDTPAE